jgi:hypothetical protein
VEVVVEHNQEQLDLLVDQAVVEAVVLQVHLDQLVEQEFVVKEILEEQELMQAHQ